MEALAGLRRVMASLPVRFDHAGFWPRAGLGLLLRALALSGSWMALRRGLTSVVAAAYTWLGGSVVRQGDTMLLSHLVAQRHLVEITASCTQVEVLLLLLPLAWDHRRSFKHELSFIAGLVAMTAALAVGRLLLALALYAQGFSWAVAHDVPLGIGYALLFITVLRRNAWVGDTTMWRRLTGKLSRRPSAGVSQ